MVWRGGGLLRKPTRSLLARQWKKRRGSDHADSLQMHPLGKNTGRAAFASFTPRAPPRPHTPHRGMHPQGPARPHVVVLVPCRSTEAALAVASAVTVLLDSCVGRGGWSLLCGVWTPHGASVPVPQMLGRAYNALALFAKGRFGRTEPNPLVAVMHGQNATVSLAASAALGEVLWAPRPKSGAASLVDAGGQACVVGLDSFISKGGFAIDVREGGAGDAEAVFAAARASACLLAPAGGGLSLAPVRGVVADRSAAQCLRGLGFGEDPTALSRLQFGMGRLIQLGGANPRCFVVDLQLDVSLPDGWFMRQSETTGRPYYYAAGGVGGAACQSSYELPTGSVVRDVRVGIRPGAVAGSSSGPASDRLGRSGGQGPADPLAGRDGDPIGDPIGDDPAPASASRRKEEGVRNSRIGKSLALVHEAIRRRDPPASLAPTALPPRRSHKKKAAARVDLDTDSDEDGCRYGLPAPEPAAHLKKSHKKKRAARDVEVQDEGDGDDGDGVEDGVDDGEHEGWAGSPAAPPDPDRRLKTKTSFSRTKKRRGEDDGFEDAEDRGDGDRDDGGQGDGGEGDPGYSSEGERTVKARVKADVRPRSGDRKRDRDRERDRGRKRDREKERERARRQKAGGHALDGGGGGLGTLNGFITRPPSGRG